MFIFSSFNFLLIICILHNSQTHCSFRLMDINHRQQINVSHFLLSMEIKLNILYYSFLPFPFCSFCLLSFFFRMHINAKKKFQYLLVPLTLIIIRDRLYERIEQEKKNEGCPIFFFLFFFFPSSTFFFRVVVFFFVLSQSSFQCVWMWFVNIDHWTLKLAYLAIQKLTDDSTKENNQVDI